MDRFEQDVDDRVHGAHQSPAWVPSIGKRQVALPCLMLIRHAEKPDKGCLGLDALGNPDPCGLSVRGWQRAGALVNFFAHPLRGELGIQRPRSIFAAVDARRSRRPALTVRPLAHALDLPIHGSHGSESPPSSVIAAALEHEGPVLLCWRHRTLPPLVAELLGRDRAPKAWDVERFDVVWVLDRPDSQRGWRFRALPQRLLPGDVSRI